MREKRPFFYGWVIVATCLISVFVAASISQTFSVYFLPISDEFGWDRAQVSLALSVNMLVTALFSTLAGKLATMYGPKKVILAGISMMALSAVLLSGMRSLWQYYLLTGLGGVGFCFSGIVPGTVLIARWFHKRRATAISVFLLGLPLSQIVLVPLSTYFMTVYGWRFSYIFYGLLFVAVTPMIFILLRDNPEPLSLEVDGENSTKVSDRHALIEREVSILGALKTPSYSLLVFVHVLCGITDIPITAHFVPLILDDGYSLLTSANILSLIGVFMLLGTIVSGPISDKFGRKNVAVMLYGIRFISIYLLLGNPDIVGLYSFAFLFGFSYFGMVSIFGAWIADNYGTSSLGKLNGVISSVHAIASSMGIYFLGSVYDSYRNYYWGVFTLLILSGAAVISTFLIKEKNALELRP